MTADDIIRLILARIAHCEAKIAEQDSRPWREYPAGLREERVHTVEALESLLAEIRAGGTL